MTRYLLFLGAVISALVSNSFGVSAQTLAEAESYMEQGGEMFTAGKYEEAVDLFAKAAEIHKSISGEMDMEYSTAILNIGVACTSLGDFETAAAFISKAAEIRKVIIGEEDERYINVLANLGVLYYNMGKFPESLGVLQSAEKSMKEGSPVCAVVYNAIASVMQDMGLYEESLPYYTKSMECAERDYGKTDPQYAVAMYNLANLYRTLGRTEEALPYFISAAAIFKDALGDKHPNYGIVLSGAAAAYSDLGQHKESLECNLEVLDIFEESLGEDHYQYAKALENTASQYSKLARYDMAVPMMKRAAELQKISFGEDHPSYAYCIANLASILFDLGDAESSKEYYIRALELIESTLGKVSFHSNTMMSLAKVYNALAEPYKALEINQEVKAQIEADMEYQFHLYPIVLNDMGLIYQGLGNDEKALECFYASIESNPNESAWDKEMHAVTLSNLSTILLGMGQTVQSQNVLNEAAAIMKELYGESHPKYYNQMHNLASLYFDMGDSETALKYNMAILEGRMELFGGKHPSSASSMNAVAACYEALGDIEEADRYYAMSLDSYEVLYGNRHPDYARVLSNRMSNGVSGYLDPLMYQTLLDNYNYNIRNTFQYLTEKERELYINSNYSESFHVLQMFGLENEGLRNDPKGAEVLYDSALSFKGLLLGASVEFMNAVRESGDEDLVSEAEKLRTLKLYLSSVNSRMLADRPEDYDSLLATADSLEHVIVRKVKDLGRYMDDMNVSWKDVAASLSRKDVAVEFISYDIDDTKKYSAAVLRKGWKSPKVTAPFSIDGDQNHLYDAVWKEVASYLKAGDNVYFSPAGAMHHIGIEYIADNKGRRMSDMYNMYRLSSTRELAIQDEEADTHDAVLYGGIDYSTDVSVMQNESNLVRNAYTRGTAVNFFTETSQSDKAPWQRLEGTKDEVETILSLLDASGYSTTLYSGDNAVEETFKALSGQKKSIIHVATHGFYMNEGREVSEELSLERSGLILAGANNHWLGDVLPEGLEDGILTAKEISVMDLEGTGLVVLSACQTGLGDVSGEGVFGLQRAFKKAGSKTLVVSLWEVDDNAAKTMMIEFYSNLAKGYSKRDAFRKAQSALMGCMFLKNGVPASGSDPYFWASFVMID